MAKDAVQVLRPPWGKTASEHNVTTHKIELSDEIPRLSLEEGEGNRIMLQTLGTGNQQVIA